MTCDVGVSNPNVRGLSARHLRQAGRLTTLPPALLGVLCVMHAPSHAKSAKAAKKDRLSVAPPGLTAGYSAATIVGSYSHGVLTGGADAGRSKCPCIETSVRSAAASSESSSSQERRARRRVRRAAAARLVDSCLASRSSSRGAGSIGRITPGEAEGTIRRVVRRRVRRPSLRCRLRRAKRAPSCAEAVPGPVTTCCGPPSVTAHLASPEVLHPAPAVTTWRQGEYLRPLLLGSILSHCRNRGS